MSDWAATWLPEQGEPPPLEPEAESQLWRRFRLHGDMAARDMLIKGYLHFARIMAGKSYAERYRDGVTFGEYFQLASVGLIEAVDRYKPDDGRASFKTYAAYRIKGAILNGLGELTEVRAQIDARGRAHRDRLASLAARGGEEADPQDEGQAEGDTFERLSKMALGLALGFMLDDVRIYQSEEGRVEDNCYTDTEMRQLRARLKDLIRLLPERERQLIERHYFEAQQFDEIAQTLALSKGRVSQLHKRALGLLQDALAGARYQEWSI